MRRRWAALVPDYDHLPRPFRTALDQLDREIEKIHQEAALAASKTCFNGYDAPLGNV
jgi:hypothetical protein